MAILGGGPIGLAALLRAREEGWDARLFERGRVGENVLTWGHVRMFSPLSMNELVRDPQAEGSSGAMPGGAEADPDELLTGRQYVDRHLAPLSLSLGLDGLVFTDTQAVAVSRDFLRKGEEIAGPARARHPFRILLSGPEGERLEKADVVLDATGTFGNPNRLGPGGIPALGERTLGEMIVYHLPDITGSARGTYEGQRTLLVGAGHSAATALVGLAALAAGAPATHVTWITRTRRPRPVPQVEPDALPERARVTRFANDLAEAGAPWLTVIRGSALTRIRLEDGRVVAELAVGGELRQVTADRVLALIGYRPDLELARELQVQTCWATEGTYPLAAALLSSPSSGGGDCLAIDAADPTTLRHPEQGFFTLGAKSYGRNPHFLIRTGLRQVEDVLGLLRDGAAHEVGVPR